MLKSLMLLAFTAVLQAGTIVISQSGVVVGSERITGPSFRSYAEVGWQTGSTAFSNVTITASLLSDIDFSQTLIAYLTTSIGTGAGAAVATSPVITVPAGSAYQDITLFTGLSLSAGTTYYLTLAPQDDQTLYWSQSAGAPITALGVSYLGANGCNDDAGNCADYPPGSPGFDSPYDYAISPNLNFSVTAQDTAVPEPGTLALAGIAIALFVWRRCEGAS